MIEINNLTTNPVDEDFLKKIAKIVLEGEKNSKSNISLAFVGQGRMREINKRYRGKNRSTDVLSFPESKVSFNKFKIGPTQKIKGLGEIIICLREVKKNVKRFGSSFEKELSKVFIHGILHLLGYEHNTIQEKEDHYLSKII